MSKVDRCSVLLHRIARRNGTAHARRLVADIDAVLATLGKVNVHVAASALLSMRAVSP